MISRLFHNLKKSKKKSKKSKTLKNHFLKTPKNDCHLIPVKESNCHLENTINTCNFMEYSPNNL